MTSPGLVPRAACSSARASACWRAAERTRTGSTGSRSRVRASIRDLRCRCDLALDGFRAADRAGCGPGSPPAGVIDGPLGQVEVEGPHRGQELAVADPLGIDHRLAAGRGGDGLLLGPHALFPAVGDLGAQVQAVDAGMVGFQVGPEHAQLAGQLLQAAVVHRWLAFPQVIDEQVTDGLAGKLVTVDHLLRRALARGAQLRAAARALPGRRSPSRAAAGSRRHYRLRAAPCTRASVSSSSSTSPILISASMPPLAARMTAARRSV